MLPPPRPSTGVRGRISLRVASSLAAGFTRCAFSLVEVLVAVSLMTIIVLGLMAMFNQTQRAFRLGMSQTDILESGRIATEMIVRELEQARPAYQPFGTAANFFVELTNRTTQTLPGNPTPPPRTNSMDDVFFLRRENQTWTGIGYFVRASNTNGPAPTADFVGTLYRFETSSNVVQMARTGGLAPGLAKFFSDFDLARRGLNTKGVSRLVDGVVHFRVQVFDTNSAAPGSLQSYFPTNSINYPRNVSDPPRVIFFSNAVPSSVELELGILEQQALESYRSIPVAAARQRLFTDQASHEHVFRQRVAIRNIDPSAYRQ